MKQEIELKYQIAHLADFNRLLATLKKQAAGSVDTVQQENIFFDTPALDLRKQHVSLRLRREDQTYYLCVKQSGLDTNLDTLSVRQEFENQISQNTADLLLAQAISPLEILSKFGEPNLEIILENFVNKNLYIIGSFSNTRTRIPVIFDNHHVLIELDQTTYPDKNIIFEIEIEFGSKQEARRIQPFIENMLRELGLATNSSVPKSQRLYKILLGAG